MRLFKRILAMGIVATLTFTGGAIPVYAAESTNIQSESVTQASDSAIAQTTNTNTSETTSDLNQTNIDKGSYSVSENSTVINDSANNIEVSNATPTPEKITSDNITSDKEATVQPEVPSTPATVDTNITETPSTPSTPVTEPTDPVVESTILAEPQALTGVQASVTSIKLTWNAVEGAETYKIYRAKKGQAYKLIQTQQGTSYTNEKLKTGTKYYYKVTAVKGDKESGYSNTVSLYAAAKSVTKFKAKSNEYNKITLTWKKSSGATKYIIYRSTNQTSGFKEIKTLTSTNYTNKVKTGITYYYKIVSYTNKAKGGESTVISATAVCKEPTSVKVTSKSSNSAKITWKKTSGADQYAIYRSDTKNSGYTLLSTVANNKSSYTDKTVSAGTKYYYKICAVTRNVEGKMSKVVSVKIKAADANNVATNATASKSATPAPTPNIIIVLDPGHGGSDPGATYGGLREKDLTLKTAQYAKTELEKYSGVTVKMTRTTDTYVGLEQRTIIAKNYGADIFVSQHYNAGSSAASGAEVLVSVNSSFNASSTKLGSQILSNLTGTGIRNRGVKARLSSTGSGDYYSVIRNSVKRGFPGIIVEGGFISSAQDRAVLSTEAGLKSIGEATAKAIAQYYGLSKK
jgi:N-acetylmuramoyl-L-alanine amidase